MSVRSDNKVPIWRLVILFLVVLMFYIILYTNATDSMKTSVIVRTVEDDVQSVWKDNFGTVLYNLKLLEQLEISHTNETSNANQNTSTLTSTQATSTQLIQIILTTELTITKCKQNNSIPLLILFTSWNDSPDKYLVHKLTMTNWALLKPFVVPVLFTNVSSVVELSTKFGFHVLPIRITAADGIPVLKYMYLDVMENFNATFYAYCNGDILFTKSLVDTLISLGEKNVNLSTPVIVVGQRTNVDNVSLEEGSSWSNIAKISNSRGKIFTGWAEDYFITTRSYPWSEIAEVVIGRRAYDNWLVYTSRKAKYTVIDATRTILAVHQTTVAGNYEGHDHSNRDYNHNLLAKMYKSLDYNRGVVECIEKFTEGVNETLQLKSRIVHRACSV